jgi:peptide/nickel transport system ATP-binding protein
MTPPLLEVTGLRKSFRGAPALEGIDLDVMPGETLALAGASGSGKTTLARCILRLIEPDAGSIRFAGEDIAALRGERLRRIRPRLQMVFQDPMAAFNPRATVARIIGDPLRIHRLERKRELPEAVAELLRRVRLSPELATRRPHELSGGQRQRVAIARAIATRPELIVLDEPVSSLDVSVRAQILNLLLDVQEESGVAYLFVSHDLAVVRAVADRVAILAEGRIVETGAPDEVFRAPQADATRALVAAVPRLRKL